VLQGRAHLRSTHAILDRSAMASQDVPKTGDHKVEEPNEGPAPAVPDKPETKLIIMKTLFESAIVKDDARVQQDVLMENFFVACQTYREVLSKLGKVAGMVLKDFDENCGKSKKAYLESPEERKTLKSFLMPHPPGGHSGIHHMMWLLRGIEFFTMFQKLAFEGDGSRAGVEAYSRTLMQYHGWLLQNTLKVAMRAFPGRKQFCQTPDVFCLEPVSPDRCLELCLRDAPLFADPMLALIQFMVDCYKQSGHWSTEKA